ncbi:MAG TPA: DNA mismatch repair protein MutS [bacterium]|nr:DNA mismatch repair protein MutS [bacterium]HPN35358.1 DNA mismatch repair protein MutS [bacterium]
MEQYLAIKSQHKDAILFFRMGDFYEMFYEDARIGSEVLGITYTSRAHGKAADVPLAGFPHHALDTYLNKMIKAGYRVAICEQTEDPKLAKTIVKREVLEIVSPGTAVSDDLLETKRNNYLVSLFGSARLVGLAVVDVSTGEFLVNEVPRSDLIEQVASLSPAELLAAESQMEDFSGLFRQIGCPVTKRDDWTFQADYCRETLTSHLGTLNLKGFGLEELTVGLQAAGAVISYLREHQKEKLVHINRIRRMAGDEYMMIDAASRRNLELIQSMNQQQKQGTLLSVLDRTHTPMGGRMLVQWILRPLLKPAAIHRRQEAIAVLFRSATLRSSLAEALAKAGDLERLLAKFATARANARDALAVLTSLRTVVEIKKLLQEATDPLLAECAANLQPLPDLAFELDRAIQDHPPLSITDGGFIKRGYSVELDKLREIAYGGKDWIARLQQQEREATGIPSLKVNFNKVFGYYIEITNPHLSKVPVHYTRKQTLVNAERYITQELKEYEERILGAEDKIVSLEYELFEQLRTRILEYTRDLQTNAAMQAQLDCLVGLAQVAVENEYVRPEVDDGPVIDIREGRHPVIEKLLRPGEPFIRNDAFLDNRTQQLLIITGPNMAGKSTFLRQVGLIVIMAQMGGFVPAASARIGVVDRVFTRVGASDNLAAGESTFLTEMNETANILNNATPSSLILLDEIGRGTSTFDGLSIAWSVAEHLHNTAHLAAKTIFATHYHELTELELILPRVKNYNVAVREWGDRIVFLRKIVPGGCDHSYGIQVAKLAGLPQEVISRAKEILQNLEAEALNGSSRPKLAEHHERQKEKVQQLNLFGELEKAVREELKNIDPNQLTPLQALSKLDELKQLASREE